MTAKAVFFRPMNSLLKGHFCIWRNLHMANRQTYTVLIPFPIGGGHWSTAGEELELLDVEASALRTAGRLELTSVLNSTPNKAD
ncbi:hypothetical protein ACDZ94_18650 [Pseudomonas sp. UBT]|uniref:hypothetical protein n=1 Tax=Pseudomonas sp. UBT TaxID=3239198 RepID=UPI003D807FA4